MAALYVWEIKVCLITQNCQRAELKRNTAAFNSAKPSQGWILEGVLGRYIKRLYSQSRIVEYYLVAGGDVALKMQSLICRGWKNTFVWFHAQLLLLSDLFPVHCTLFFFSSCLWDWTVQTCFDRPILPRFFHLAALSHLQTGAFAKPSFPSNVLLLTLVSCKCNYSSLPISFINDREGKGSETECVGCMAMLLTGNVRLPCQTTSSSSVAAMFVRKDRRGRVCKMIPPLILDGLGLV